MHGYLALRISFCDQKRGKKHGLKGDLVLNKRLYYKTCLYVNVTIMSYFIFIKKKKKPYFYQGKSSKKEGTFYKRTFILDRFSKNLLIECRVKSYKCNTFTRVKKRGWEEKKNLVYNHKRCIREILLEKQLFTSL